MSVRAYKLIEIKTENEPTFNCWRDKEILEHANLEEYNEGGLIEFSRGDIEEVIKDKEQTSGMRQTAKAILKDMGNKDYVEYYCY